MNRNNVVVALSIVSIIMTLRNMHNVNKLATVTSLGFEAAGHVFESLIQEQYDDIFVDIVNHMNES